MDAFSALWHFVNFFAPSLAMGLIAAAITRLLWPGALRGVSFIRLWLWPAAAMALISLAGLVFFGRDGKMATYVAMVVACALALWFAGFARRGQ